MSKKAYYKGLFKIHTVEIISSERYRELTWNGSIMDVYYKYLIKFKSGKLKFVHENKLIL